MGVTKSSVTYHLTSKLKKGETKEDINLDLEIDPSGTVTITPAWPGKGDSFKFKSSDPDLVEHIANQLLKAVAVARKEKF